MADMYLLNNGKEEGVHMVRVTLKMFRVLEKDGGIGLKDGGIGLMLLAQLASKCKDKSFPFLDGVGKQLKNRGLVGGSDEKGYCVHESIRNIVNSGGLVMDGPFCSVGDPIDRSALAAHGNDGASDRGEDVDETREL